jgi:hypothetical protein
MNGKQMSEWREKWPEARPRWGTYSVRSHTDLGRLIADALLYDVLVFPCPEDDADFSRWEDAGWDPELLALRVTQLGDAAVTVPWDASLRQTWEYKYNQLTEEQRNNPEIAYDLTSWQLSTQSFLALMGEGDDRIQAAISEPPQIHPRFEESDGRLRAQYEQLELIAAFQKPWEALCFAGASNTAQPIYMPDEAARLQLRLAVPEEADESVFHRTLDLIGNEDFQRARRRLWSWEKDLPSNVDPREAQLGLEALVNDYNTAVRKEIKQARLKTVFLFVPIGAGLAIDMLVTGGIMHAFATAGAGVVVDRMKAHFPLLTGAAIRASHNPGSAIEGMLSVVAGE